MVNGGYLGLSRQKELVTFMQTIKNGVSVDVLPVNAQKNRNFYIRSSRNLSAFQHSVKSTYTVGTIEVVSLYKVV